MLKWLCKIGLHRKRPIIFNDPLSWACPRCGRCEIYEQNAR